MYNIGWLNDIDEVGETWTGSESDIVGTAVGKHCGNKAGMPLARTLQLSAKYCTHLSVPRLGKSIDTTFYGA